jgi:hypothetical protein
MNVRISETRLRGVCQELLRLEGRVTHRRLRNVLRERFGAAGKTTRVLRIWREESERLVSTKLGTDRLGYSDLPTDVVELQDRLAEAEVLSNQMRIRAELAELREQSHQDRWMLEIDRLREALRNQPNYAREVRAQQSTITRLTVELAATRGALTAVLEQSSGRQPSGN